MTTKETICQLEDLKDEYDDFPDDKEAIIMAIEALKQPEIIRCKDCYWFDNSYCEFENTDPNAFCSHAEIERSPAK